MLTNILYVMYSWGIPLEVVLIPVFICLFFNICNILIYRKAGYSGWEPFIPIYNVVCKLNMIGMHPALVLVTYLPVIGWIFSLVILFKLVKSFDMSIGMFLLILFVPIIGYPIWALSNRYQYEGV